MRNISTPLDFFGLNCYGGFHVAADDGPAGYPVDGDFVWSFFDNFEWTLGYGPRFGLVYVDYPTQRRIPKDSFAFYRNLICTRRLPTAGKL